MTVLNQPKVQLVIGVDGGQSGTQTVLATVEGEILAAAVTGPIIHVEIEGAAEQICQVLHQGYEQVLTAANVDSSQVCSVYLGGGALNDPERIKSVYQVDRVTKSGDSRIAMMGAFPVDHVGVIVTAGTGSHAFGRRSDGVTAFSGGRGYYLGDEGGAYNIAQQALRAVYQADDGRSAETALTTLILAHFQCQDLEQLLFKIYANTYSRDQLAQVSKLVGQAAAEGDPVARRILADAGDELGKAVVAVLRSLEQIDNPFPVAPNGSVFNAGRFITEPMMTRIQATNPQAYLTEARFSPAIGAVLLALLNGGITIDERILKNLESTKGKTFQKDTMRKKS